MAFARTVVIGWPFRNQSSSNGLPWATPQDFAVVWVGQSSRSTKVSTQPPRRQSHWMRFGASSLQLDALSAWHASGPPVCLLNFVWRVVLHCGSQAPVSTGAMSVMFRT